MKNKNIRRMIVQLVIIFTLIISAYAIKTYMAKDYSNEAFQSFTILFTKQSQEKANEIPKIEDADLEKYSKTEILDIVKEVIAKEKNPAIEELNRFGNEFRVKAKEISDDEKQNVKAKLQEKYKDKKISVSLGNIENFPPKKQSQDLLMYVVYVLVILAITGLALFFIDLSEKRRDK